MGLGGFFVDLANGAKSVLRDKQLTTILLVAAVGFCSIVSFIGFVIAFFF